MKLVILAAGRGSRLGALTLDKPKGLVELNGISLIERILKNAEQFEFEEIGLVVGYLKEKFNSFPHTIFENADWEQTNIVSSLMKADAWLSSGPVIVSYSDIFYTSEALRLLQIAESQVAVLYDPNWLDLWHARFVDVSSDAESFSLEHETGFITSIGGRIANLDKVEGQYMGIMKWTPEAWEQVKEIGCYQDLSQIDMTGLLMRLIAETSISIKGIPYQGYWGEIDSLTDLAIAQKIAVKLDNS